MNRRTALIFCFAALFGLRAPICAWACIESAPPTPVAMAAHHTPSAEPCHGGAPTTPEEAPSSDPGCGCDTFQLLLAKSLLTKSDPVSQGLEIPTPPLATAPSVLAHAFAMSARQGQQQRSLPAPNILLLNATLLI